MKAAPDMGHKVHANKIKQTEGAARRNAQGPADDRIRFVDREAGLERLDDRHRDPETTDPVGHESGRISAVQNRLSKDLLAGLLDYLSFTRRRRRPRYDFDQRHNARRIEEMSDHEALAEALLWPSIRRASGMVEVLDEITESGLRTESIWANRS